VNIIFVYRKGQIYIKLYKSTDWRDIST